jgi:hypothetical protein
MDENYYKVVRLLDELPSHAAQAQKTGISLDMPLSLRDNKYDGAPRAEVAPLDPATGKLMNAAENALPLDSPGAVGWFFGWIAEKGLPLTLERRTEPGYRRAG